MSNDQRDEIGAASNQQSSSAPTVSNARRDIYDQPVPSSQNLTIGTVIDDINYGDRGTDDVKNFCRGFCINNDIPIHLQPTETERQCAALAEKAREEFKKSRQSNIDLVVSCGNYRSPSGSSARLGNSYHTASSSPAPTTAVAFPASFASSAQPTNPQPLTKEQRDDLEKRLHAKKYETRLRNNRRSAHASKVYREVYRCALSSAINKLSHTSQITRNVPVSGTDLDPRLIWAAPSNTGQIASQSPNAEVIHSSPLAQTEVFSALPTHRRSFPKLQNVTSSLPASGSCYRASAVNMRLPPTLPSASGQSNQPSSLPFYLTGSGSFPVHGLSAANETTSHVTTLRNANFNRPLNVFELQTENDKLKLCCKQQFAFLIREGMVERFRAYQQAEEDARQPTMFLENEIQSPQYQETVEADAINQIFPPSTTASHIAIGCTQYHSITDFHNVSQLNPHVLVDPASRSGERLLSDSGNRRDDEHSETAKYDGSSGSV